MAAVVVVGGGIAGLACARELHAAGRAVTVLDRGRAVGGRMSGRTRLDRVVDLGASYLTVSDDAFDARVADWTERHLARPWTDTFLALAPGREPEVKTGPTRFGAPGGLRSLVVDLAADLPDVRTEQEVREVRRAAGAVLVDGEPADAVVLALPDPQARRLLGDGLAGVRDRLDREFEPTLALAVAWPGRTWDALSPTGRFDGAFVADHDVLSWVADDGRRRGDDAPVLVAHSTPGFAAQHLDDPEAAGPAMLAALRSLVDVPESEPTDLLVHRWTFAKPTGERDEPFLLDDGDEDGPDGEQRAGLVGVCGDGWGAASKVETAYLSGRALGLALAERLG